MKERRSSNKNAKELHNGPDFATNHGSQKNNFSKKRLLIWGFLIFFVSLSLTSVIFFSVEESRTSKCIKKVPRTVESKEEKFNLSIKRFPSDEDFDYFTEKLKKEVAIYKKSAPLKVKEEFFKNNVVNFEKFTVILRRGRLFVIETAKMKHLAKYDVSPTALVDANNKTDVVYDELLIDGNLLVVSGYRKSKKAQEFEVFTINEKGVIERKSSHFLAMTRKNGELKFENGEITIRFSSHLFVNGKTILPKIDRWIEGESFVPKKIMDKTDIQAPVKMIFDPMLHSKVSCQVLETFEFDCSGSAVIESPMHSYYISDKNNLYFWVSEQNFWKSNTKRDSYFPVSFVYRLTPENNLKVMPVLGDPIGARAFSEKENGDLMVFVDSRGAQTPSFGSNKKANLRKIGYLKITDKNFSEQIRAERNNFANLSMSRRVAFDGMISGDYFAFKGSSNKVYLQKVGSKKKSSRVSLNHSIESLEALEGGFLAIGKNNQGDLAFSWIDPQKAKVKDVFYINKTEGSEKEVLEYPGNMFVGLVEREGFVPQKVIGFPVLRIVRQEETQGSAKTEVAEIRFLKIGADGKFEELEMMGVNRGSSKQNDLCKISCHENWYNNPHVYKLNGSIYNILGYELIKAELNSQEKFTETKRVNYFAKPIPPKPRITAPKPHGAKKVNGKYVCAKKNDKPKKSSKNPEGHLDMECCLDPDEYPNPWCTYKPGELSVTKYRYENYKGKK